MVSFHNLGDLMDSIMKLYPIFPQRPLIKRCGFISYCINRNFDILVVVLAIMVYYNGLHGVDISYGCTKSLPLCNTQIIPYIMFAKHLGNVNGNGETPCEH
jgi:formate-dependent nitrite reductase membrane component NrfD